MKDLYQISGKHFVAGLEVNGNGIVVNCAPILYKWCMNRHIDELKKICAKRKLDISLISESTPSILSQFFIDE